MKEFLQLTLTLEEILLTALLKIKKIEIRLVQPQILKEGTTK